MANEPAIIFIGGDPPDASVIAALPAHGFVIAADAGWNNALAAGRVPDVLVGDMDSIPADQLSDARARGVEVIEHSPHKDFTDSEIAMDLARGRGHRSVHIVSGGGNRFDHLLALVHSMVAHSRDCELEAHIGSTKITFLNDGDLRTFNGVVGQTISLIPLGGDARGVDTTGLKWELRDGTLESFASRGVSNEAAAESITVSLREGALAVLVPLNT